MRYRETIPDCLVNGVGYLARDIDLPTPIRASALPPYPSLPHWHQPRQIYVCTAITVMLILNESKLIRSIDAPGYGQSWSHLWQPYIKCNIFFTLDIFYVSGIELKMYHPLKEKVIFFKNDSVTKEYCLSKKLFTYYFLLLFVYLHT